MRRCTLLFNLLLLVLTSIFAQAPQAFSYQTFIRSGTGEILPGQAVSLRIKFIQDSVNGMPVYTESHNKTTNPFGLVTLDIGYGIIESGVFEDIEWGKRSYFLQV